MLTIALLPSVDARQPLSYDDCLEDKRKDCQNFALLCTIMVDSDMHICMYMNCSYRFRSALVCHTMLLPFCLFAVVALGLISSVLSHWNL